MNYRCDDSALGEIGERNGMQTVSTLDKTKLLDVYERSGRSKWSHDFKRRNIVSMEYGNRH